MNDAEYFLRQVREVVVQLEPVEQKLRRIGVSHAFLDGQKLPERAIECWVEIEKMLGLSAELTDMFGLGMQAGPAPKPPRRSA